MKIKPTDNWKSLGTSAQLSTEIEYEAEWAYNQPGWQDGRKLFTGDPELTSFLLKRGDYVITEADRPVDLDRVEWLLKQWLATQADAEDSATARLIDLTTDFLEDLQQSNA